MLSTWDTRNTRTGSTASNTIKLPLESSGTYNFTIDWGDGTPVQTITAWDQAEVTHVYAVEGEYQIETSGPLKGWSFNNTGDRLKLLSVDDWDNDFELGNSGGYFYGCSNLVTFAGCNSSATTNFTNAWRDNNLTSFPLIDTSSGTNFSVAWYNNNLTSFPLIDTSSGTNFSFAWYNNNLTSFPLIDTSSGTNFSFAWRDNNNLTSFPLIDTSSGTNFTNAWRDNNLTSFPLIDTSSGTNFTNAWIHCPLTTTAYNGILTQLNANNNTGVTLTANLAKYGGEDAVAARARLIANGWTLKDAGEDRLIYVPLKANDPTQDVLGNPAQYTGKVPMNVPLVNSPCLTLDGGDDSIIPFQTSYDSSVDDFEIRTTRKLEPSGTWQLIARLGESHVDGFSIMWNSTNDTLAIWHKGSQSSVAFIPSGWHDFLVVKTGQVLKVSVDGSLAFSHNITNQIAEPTINHYCVENPTGFRTKASIASHVFIRNGVSEVDYNFEENAGSTIYDRSGNGNHGTLINATESAAWSSTQDARHTNITDGCSKYTHGSERDLYVPFANGSPLSITVPAGYTLDGHYPAGLGLNVDSAAIDFTLYSNSPEFDGLTLPSEYRKGDGPSGDLQVNVTPALDNQFTIRSE